MGPLAGLCPIWLGPFGSHRRADSRQGCFLLCAHFRIHLGYSTTTNMGKRKRDSDEEEESAIESGAESSEPETKKKQKKKAKPEQKAKASSSKAKAKAAVSSLKIQVPRLTTRRLRKIQSRRRLKESSSR